MAKVGLVRKVIKDRAIQCNQLLPLVDYLIPLVGNKKRVRILDVGSGPFPITGQRLRGVMIELHYCDKQDFTEFWEELGLTPTFKIERQNMEKLTYLNDSFDVVHCVNALDHTVDALAALREILRVTKHGGWVYIDCALDQLTIQRKKHYWDAKEDGKLVNPTGEIDLKEFGFSIDFINNPLGRQYSHMIARKNA